MIESRRESIYYRWSPLLHAKVGMALFLSVMLVILIAPIRTPFYFYDEGFAVLNATRVVGGDAPYKDFWAIYPPGQLYTLAALFKMLGASLATARIYDTIVRFFLVIGVYAIARKITTEGLAVVAGIAATLAMVSVGFYAYAVYPALAFSVWAIWSSLHYPDSGRRGWLFLAGVLAGISSLYRWDIGLYASASLTLGVFIFHFSKRPLETAGVQGSAREKSRLSVFFPAIKMGLWVLSGTVLIILTGYGLVSLRSGVYPLWEQVVWFPTTKLHDVRWRAYPSLIPPSLPKLSDFWNFYSGPMDWVRFYLPLAIFCLALGYYAYALLGKRIAINRQHFGTIVAALYGPLLFAQALSRYDYIHVLPSTMLTSLVIVSLFSQPDLIGSAVVRAIKILLFALLPVMVAVYFTAPLDVLHSTLKNTPPWDCYSRLARASCAYTGENQQKAVVYIRRNTQEGEPIFVGNLRHDYVFVNDVGFYFLADRPSATRYSELHPGVATTLQVQKEIAGEIDSKNVRMLVLVDIPNSNEPNESALSSGVHYLDDFIRSEFILDEIYGEYQIWKRAP